MTGARNYHQYLKGLHWKNTRAKALKRAGYRCQRCGKRFTLETHHTNYSRLGHEHVNSDLRVLCHTCHRAIHGR